MWTCSLLKQNAKQALYGRYWRCFGVCVLLTFMGVLSATTVSVWPIIQLYGGNKTYFAYDESAGSHRFANGTLRPAAYSYGPQRSDLFDILPVVFGAALAVIAVVLVLAFCWGTFLTNPMTVGRARYFMESRQAPAPVSTVFSVFDKGYMNIVKVQLLTSMKILAGCLIIVPGIYWFFCYLMVPYLLAENPYLTTGRAMELSRQMMEGEKWHAFVLGLSFLGWEILAGFVPFGLGGWFLGPYYQATFAELYAALRSKAFAYGMSDASELGGFVTRDLSAGG